MGRKTKAFTLAEILIVIVIIAILAAFGFPNYAKAVAKADEHNIIANLVTMRAAINLYVENGGTVGNWNNIAAINTNLGLSILDTRASYSCSSSGGYTNGCTAVHPSGWSLQFHEEDSSGGVHCSAGTCPSCPAQPGRCG
jgi:prepilin-type N-terminal cleavage/methylation domain-containing protein